MKNPEKDNDRIPESLQELEEIEKQMDKEYLKRSETPEMRRKREYKEYMRDKERIRAKYLNSLPFKEQLKIMAKKPRFIASVILVAMAAIYTILKYLG